METRVRLSRGSSEVQTGQSQAIMGIPCEVPVPSRVTFMGVEIPSMFQGPNLGGPIIGFGEGTVAEEADRTTDWLGRALSEAH